MSDEFDPARKRNELLARNPFTRTFLDMTPLSQNIPLWAEALQTASKPLKDELRERIGDKWELGITGSLSAMAKMFEIFQNDVPQQNSDGTIQSLFLLGYEIGDMGEVSFLISDIRQQLASLEIFNTHGEVIQTVTKLVNFVIGVIYAGAYIRRNLDHKSAQEIPPAFRKFIEGLDL